MISSALSAGFGWCDSFLVIDWAYGTGSDFWGIANGKTIGRDEMRAANMRSWNAFANTYDHEVLLENEYLVELLFFCFSFPRSGL